MIISLDTSSTAVGVAAFHHDGRNADRTCRLTPNYSGAACVAKFTMLADEVKAYLNEIWDEFGPITIAVIEEAPTFSKQGSIAPQNRAYGVILHLLHSMGIKRIYEVKIATWTKGKSKESRQWRLRQKLGLAESDDRGGDALDALMLGQWWCARNPDKLIRERQAV